MQSKRRDEWADAQLNCMLPSNRVDELLESATGSTHQPYGTLVFPRKQMESDNPFECPVESVELASSSSCIVGRTTQNYVAMVIVVIALSVYCLAAAIELLNYSPTAQLNGMVLGLNVPVCLVWMSAVFRGQKRLNYQSGGCFIVVAIVTGAALIWINSATTRVLLVECVIVSIAASLIPISAVACGRIENFDRRKR
jgi:hypothetical protein